MLDVWLCLHDLEEASNLGGQGSGGLLDSSPLLGDVLQVQ